MIEKAVGFLQLQRDVSRFFSEWISGLRCGVGDVGSNGRGVIGSGKMGVCGWRARDSAVCVSRAVPRACTARGGVSSRRSILFCYSRVSVESARVADVKHYYNRAPVTKQIFDVMCMVPLCSILWFVLSLNLCLVIRFTNLCFEVFQISVTARALFDSWMNANFGAKVSKIVNHLGICKVFLKEVNVGIFVVIGVARLIWRLLVF